MAPDNVVVKWFGRNWPLVITGTVLGVGVGVLLLRSTEYSSPPTAEATVVVVPSETVVFPGRATVVVPGDDSSAKPGLVSDTHVAE